MHFLWFLHYRHCPGLACRTIDERWRHGLIGDLIIGVIGAFIGGWLFGVLGISAGGLIGSLITATVGAVVLIFLLRAIKRA